MSKLYMIARASGRTRDVTLRGHGNINTTYLYDKRKQNVILTSQIESLENRLVISVVINGEIIDREIFTGEVKKFCLHKSIRVFTINGNVHQLIGYEWYPFFIGPAIYRGKVSKSTWQIYYIPRMCLFGIQQYLTIRVIKWILKSMLEQLHINYCLFEECAKYASDISVFLTPSFLTNKDKNE